MKTNCPHCNKRLKKSKNHANLFMCKSNRNNINHYYTYNIFNHYEIIGFFGGLLGEFWFVNVKSIGNQYIPIEDFSIFKDKTIKEIQSLYNKLVTFQ